MIEYGPARHSIRARTLTAAFARVLAFVERYAEAKHVTSGFGGEEPATLQQIAEDLAELDDSGPMAGLNGYAWLRRVREGGGDQDLRRFALEVLRTCPASHGEHSPELVDRLAAFVDDPALGSPALRPWMASDVWIWREIAKIAFEWGGAERTGDSLVRQVAVVVHCHLLGRDPAPGLDAVCERLPRLPDAFDLDGAMFEIAEARGDVLPGERIRQILAQWDDGVLTRGGVQNHLSALALETDIDQVLALSPEPWGGELFEYFRGWAESESDEPIDVGSCVYSYQWEPDPIEAQRMKKEVEDRKAADREHFKRVTLPAIRAWWARRQASP